MSLGYEMSQKRHVGYYMFTTTFNLVTKTTVSFEKMKDGSLLIHNLASFNCFTHRPLSKWLQRFVKNA